MALIGKLRERSGLILGLVALAVAGFVIMDMTNAGPRGNSGGLFSDPNTLAKVDGEKITMSDFTQYEQLVYSNSQMDQNAKRTNVWNYFVDNIVVGKQAEKAGLAVSSDELHELQFGADKNLSPLIAGRFGDQSTGSVDRARLNSFEQAIKEGKLTNPEIRAYWAQQEKDIIKERLQSKLTTMVSKAIYAPTWLVEQNFIEQNSKADFTYVRVPFSAVKDEEAVLTDGDYEKYLSENKALYIREKEGRKVTYASFRVIPTSADSAKIRKQLADLVADWRVAKNDSTYVTINNGIYSDGYVKKAEISPAVADSIAGGSIGRIFGPYVDGSTMKVAKLLGKMAMADSVRARHVLLRVQNPQAMAATQQFADSLKGALVAGKISWDSLNVKYNQDQAAQMKGGDLGYAGPGMMVKEFNDLIFFKADQGKTYTVATQFGVHIVQVTGKKNIKNESGYKVAYLTNALVPSEETQNKIQDKALAFLSANQSIEAMKKTADASNGEVRIETSPAFEENDYSIGQLGSGSTSREIARWAFGNDAKVGKVAPSPFAYQNPGEYYTNKFVVAALKNVLPEGMPRVADIKEDIELQARNAKKGEILKGKIAGSKDLAGLASTYGSKIDTAKQVGFASMFVPGLNSEPKVIANAFACETGSATDAIVGNGGVYVAQMMAKNQAVPPADVTSFKKQLVNMYRGQTQQRLIPALRKSASIKDMRSKFF